jgi:hypothetical protein
VEISIFVWTYSHGYDDLRLTGVLAESVDGENVASNTRRVGCKSQSRFQNGRFNSGVELVHVHDFWEALW